MSSDETTESLYEKGRQCLKARDYVQAGALFEECLRMDPGYLPAMISLGFVLQTRSYIRPALTVYRRALQLSPNSSAILNGIGRCYQAGGDFIKATACFRGALKANPDDAGAMVNLTLIHQYRPDAPLARELQRLYQSPGCKGQSRALVCLGLARIQESHGDVKRAFSYYAEANAVQFPLVEYDEARYLSLFEEIEGTFTSQFFRRPGSVGCRSAAPIFVLGMPRSGTSLVEQILASHSGVYGAGETSIMPWIAESHIPRTYGRPFPVGVVDTDASGFAGLADLYLERLSEYCANKTARIVDKTPNNFFLIGLIRLLLPSAPIIHCVRDPMDSCWSMFRQCFVGTAHGYCYDQGALGRFYRRYQRLMDHWQKVLPGETYEVRYEELVERPEKTIRALMKHCGLPWEEKCLAFYRTKRVVNTSSAMQVRRPIYKTSIRSWLPVAEALAPLRTALEEPLARPGRRES